MNPEIEVAKDSNEIDKYYVKNSKILKKLTIENAVAKLGNQLAINEVIEHQLFANQGMYGNTKMVPSGMSGDTAVYYFITLTNKRLYITGFTQFFKPIESIIKDFHEIRQVTEIQSIKEIPYIILPEDQKDKCISTIELDDRTSELVTTEDVIRLMKGIEKHSIPNKLANRNKWYYKLFTLRWGVLTFFLIAYFLYRVIITSVNG